MPFCEVREFGLIIQTGWYYICILLIEIGELCVHPHLPITTYPCFFFPQIETTREKARLFSRSVAIRSISIYLSIFYLFVSVSHFFSLYFSLFLFLYLCLCLCRARALTRQEETHTLTTTFTTSLVCIVVCITTIDRDRN